MNYIFSIGGTGAKCLEALIYLCAMGVGPKKIKPIIIDADESNGNVTRTIEIIKKYRSIRAELSDVKEKTLFYTDIDFHENDFINPLDYLDEDQAKLRKFYDYDILSEDKKLLVDILFSKSELDMELNIGFRGIPSIGSVVMDNLQYEKVFESVIDRFEQEESNLAFIFSSIFGGTGASGYPVISKMLNDINENSRIAGSIMLPYFKFNRIKHSDDIQPDSSTFTYNTIGALPFYSKYMENDTNYILGDYVNDNFYESCPGGKKQLNAAYFLEFISALSFLHYFYDWEQGGPQFQALQINRDKEPHKMDIKPEDLPLKLKNFNLEYYMEKFGLFVSIYDDLMEVFGKKRFDQITWIRDSKLNRKSIKNSKSSLQNVEEFLDFYKEWYNQISTNESSALKFYNGFNLENLLFSNPDKYKNCNNYDIDKYISSKNIDSKNTLDTLVTLLDKGLNQFIKSEGA